ncbi:MAG: hypothetical protein JW822_10600 [Spirochaetales bacterium]|nr:hypothetical protein [Spirochaetales bacterium]
MRVCVSRVVFFLLCFLCMSRLNALEIKKDRIKLVLYENTGIFSLYYLKDAEKEKYVPFLLDKDPRTSFLSLSIWNKIHRMGGSGDFIQRIELTAQGARFIWISKQLQVIQDFIIQGTQVKIVLVLFNISQVDQSVGVRYLFDTYLGEKAGPHFVTDTGVEISKETTLDTRSSLSYWISPLQMDKGSEQIGMRVITRGSGVTPADKIVFGNWKRLNESLWFYRTDDMRDFNDLPYSVNDSAVCHYYNPVVLKSGESRKIVLVIGNRSEPAPDHTDIVETTKPIEKDLPEEISTLDEDLNDFSDYPVDYADIMNNMDSINRVIKDLNLKINAGEMVSDTELELFKKNIIEVEKIISQ